MAIPFLAEIERLITEHGSAAVLRERLALANDRFAALELQVAGLKDRVLELEAENSKLREQARTAAPATTAEGGAPAGKQVDVQEHRGARFRRLPGGGYEQAVYCGRCGNLASEFVGNYDCSCGWHTDFSGKRLDAVIAEISV